MYVVRIELVYVRVGQPGPVDEGGQQRREQDGLLPVRFAGAAMWDRLATCPTLRDPANGWPGRGQEGERRRLEVVLLTA